MVRHRRLGWLLAASCFLLTACGSDGDAVVVPPPTALPQTVAVAGPAQAEVAATVSFASADAPTAGLSYRWDFGDGGSATAAAASHQYAQAGDYVVTLTVSNEAGASKVATATVVVRHFTNTAGSVCSGASASGWCWQNPKPNGNTMNDMVFVDASTGWAVGESGAILKTGDGGVTWVGQTSGVTANLSQVRFFDRNTGWAVGDSGTVLRTVDGGQSWQRQVAVPGGYAYYGVRLWLVNGSTAVLSTSGYGVSSTTDGGATWSAVTNLSAPISAVTSDGALWAVDYYAGVRRSSDLGKTWTTVLSVPASVASFGSIGFGDAANGWVMGTEYGVPYDYYSLRTVIWRTRDGGSTWVKETPVGLPSATSNGVVTFYGSDVGWLGTYSTPHRTVDGGRTWTALTLPAGFSYVYTLQTVDANTAWFSSGNGVYLTRDGGASWRLLAVDAETSTYGDVRLQIIDGSQYWLHYAGRSYRSADAGATFTRALGPEVADANSAMQAVWFFDARNGLAVGSAGAILETHDGGVTWARKALAATGSIYERSRLQFASASTGWLKLGSSAVYKTTDGGSSWWAPLGGVAISGLQDFHFIDGTQGWALGSNMVYRSADGGQSWQQAGALPGSNYYDGFTALRFIDANIGVVVGSGGTVLRTTDGGNTWTLRPSGTAADLRRVVFVSATVGWAVGSNGTVIKTVDAGLTWSGVGVPTSNTLNDVFFVDANHGSLVGDGGTVVTTTDGGRSWTLQSSGTTRSLYSAFFTDGQTGWLVGSGGAILATATGGN